MVKLVLSTYNSILSFFRDFCCQISYERRNIRDRVYVLLLRRGGVGLRPWKKRRWTTSLRCGWPRVTPCGTCTDRTVSGVSPLPWMEGRRGSDLRRVGGTRYWTFSIDTKVANQYDDGAVRVGRFGQVYDLHSLYWHARFSDNGREKRKAPELGKFGV